MGFPSAATPAKVYFTPAPCASTVRVRLFGTGSGSYFDFSTFSFQVPTSGLLCACTVKEPATARRATATNRKTCFMCDPPWVRTFSFQLLNLLRGGKLPELRKQRAPTIGRSAAPVKWVGAGLLDKLEGR